MNDEHDPNDEDVIENLKNFKKTSKLRSVALNILVKMLPPSEVETLKKQFEEIDKDNSGFIDAEELGRAMKINKSITISDEEIDDIIKQVSYYGHARINYTEFLAATIKVKKVLNKARIWNLFKSFDTDDSGFITE